MRKFSCLLLAGLLTVVYGCSPSVSRKPYFDALEPATVLTLEQDTTLVLVRDFFPSADPVEKTDSPHMKVIPHPGYDTVMVVLRDDTPLMTVLNVHVKGQTGHIPVRKKVPVSEKVPRLAVFPPLPDTDALFTLRAENTPATLYVFWQNSLVQTVHITDSYNVMLPGFAALQDRSWIRAWAVNDYGISNDLLIPLEKGRPVIQPERLDSQDKHTLIMYQVFVDCFFNGNRPDDHKADYCEGNLEGIIRKINQGFFSDLVVNAIELYSATENPYGIRNDSTFNRLLHMAHDKQMKVILNHYVKDVNLYQSFLNSTVNTDGSFVDLWHELQSGLMQYGYHNLTGNISGNHDNDRYISLAGRALPKDADSDIAYEYLAMLHAFNMTLPGVPCIYYGDEIGMPGANDPDNRRMMAFDGYTPMQIRLKERVKRLISLRNSNMALLYGDLFPLHVSPDVLAYVRIYMDQVVAVCINKGDDFFDIRSLELPFGLNTDDLVPYMGETMVAPKGFAIMTND